MSHSVGFDPIFFLYFSYMAMGHVYGIVLYKCLPNDRSGELGCFINMLENVPGSCKWPLTIFFYLRNPYSHAYNTYLDAAQRHPYNPHNFLFAVAMTATFGPGNLSMTAMGKPPELIKRDVF